MPKFHVKVPEVWIQTVEVEAETQGEAIAKVATTDEGDYLDGQLEYSNTMKDLSWWDAEEITAG
jgi:hypothetical protein